MAELDDSYPTPKLTVIGLCNVKRCKLLAEAEARIEKYADFLRLKDRNYERLEARLAAACPKDCYRHACIGSQATKGEPRGPCNYKRGRS